nr:PREDICTED: odorant receptor 13a-like [Linepithema humile]
MELLRIEFSNLSAEDKNVNKDFLNLVTKHTFLLNQAKLLKDTIGFSLSVQLLMSCILISIIGFQFILALKVGDIIMTAKTIMVLLTFLTQLFVYSVVSEYLKYQVEEFAHSIYYCNWHCLSVRLMKNVLFIIARSQQPVQFAAGNFLVVNMGTFTSILKTSFSYLSVLRMTLDM